MYVHTQVCMYALTSPLVGWRVVVDNWNTPGNIVPQWTGHTLHELQQQKDEVQCTDNLFALFSQRGYVTAAMQRDPDNREIAVRLKQVCA